MVAMKEVASKARTACVACRVLFVQKRARQTLCSDACARAARKGKPIKNKKGSEVACGTCAKTFYLPPHRLSAAGGQKFCGVSCHDTAQRKTKVSCNCLICGVIFLVSPYFSGRKYCSIPCRDQCPEFKRNCWIENNLQLQKRKQPTSLEVAGRSILDRCGFQFREQVLIADKFTVDALVVGKLIVQWDGDYWHGYRAIGDTKPLDTRQARRAMLDKSQDSYMAKAGFTVLRFWDHDVKDSPDAVLLKIMNAANAVTGEPFPQEVIDKLTTKWEG